MRQPEEDERRKPGEEEGGEGRTAPFWRSISTAGLILMALFCLTVTAQVMTAGYANLAGYSVFRVVTGSMEPTIPTGSVLLSRQTEIEDIAVGDIICFRARIPEIYNAIVTHRVVNAARGPAGEVYLETRGDANAVSDAYYVDADNLVGRVVWYSGRDNLLTNIAAFLSGQIGFLSCVVFPVMLLAGLIMHGAVKNLRKEIRSVREQLLEEAQPEPEEELLPGYTTLTQKDYEELYERLKQEILEDLKET